MSESPFNGRTALLLRVAAVAVPVSLLLSAGAAVGALVASRQVADENRDRREASCAAGDETRTILRQLSKDSALEVGEAIIEVAGGGDEPPDPEVVRQFRAVMDRRLTAIVNQLPGREWDSAAQECVDIPLTTEPGG